MKKNSLIVLRVFIGLAAWFLVHSCYALFIDPMLEGKVPELIRLILNMMLVPYTLGIGLTYLILRGMEVPDRLKKDSTANDFKKVTFGFMFKGFCVMLGLSMPIMIIVNLISMLLGIPVGGMSPDMILGENWIFYLITLLIFAPVMEEILFRKLSLDRLAVIGDVPAILISAFFFGLPHLYSQGIVQMFGTFIIALVWGYIRLKTGKIWPGMILHSLFNLYGCYFTVFMAQSTSTAAIVGLLNMIVLPTLAIIFMVKGRKQAKLKAQTA